MKRNLLLACSFAVISAVALMGCNKEENKNVVEPTTTPEVTEVPEVTDEPSGEVAPEETTPEVTPEETIPEEELPIVDETIVDTSSEKVTAAVDKIKTNYSGLYLPNMQMDAEIFSSLCGVSPELYVGFFGEMPMISAQSDMLLVVEPAEGKVEEVVGLLNAYKDTQINNTMQYPTNAIQVQATQVYEKDGLVYYIAIFGDVNDVLEDEDALLTKCQDSVNEIISIIDAE